VSTLKREVVKRHSDYKKYKNNLTIHNEEIKRDNERLKNEVAGLRREAGMKTQPDNIKPIAKKIKHVSNKMFAGEPYVTKLTNRPPTSQSSRGGLSRQQSADSNGRLRGMAQSNTVQSIPNSSRHKRNDNGVSPLRSNFMKE